jgi:protein phosphatase
MGDENREEDTVVPLPESGSPLLWPDSGSTRVDVDLAAQSDCGLKRTTNEDHYLVVRYGRSLETVQTSLPPGRIPADSREVGYGLLVADGMGGNFGGELASRTAISALVSLVLHTPDWVLTVDPEETKEVMRRFANRYRRIQEVLRERGRDDPTLAKMGTTMTMACSLGTNTVIGHIGDSRAYLFRGGRLSQLTRDHTYVQAMMDSGQMTAEEAARHPWRHVISRSLSASGITYEGDFQRLSLVDGDHLLLCTDGLTNMVDDLTIASVLASAPSSKEACQILVAKALENGGTDNVTIALARYRISQ